MKAVKIHEYGGPEKLLYEDAPKPQPKEYEILIKVKAVSVNHLDLLVASGKRPEIFPISFPWTPGYDVAGIVESTGDGCNSFRAGDEVYAKCVGGSYAEYMTLPADYAAKKPGNLDFSEAAAIPHVGLTAWQALFEHGNLKSGQKVLIHGAGGGVGMIAVQLAKNAGAEVFATASHEDFDCLNFLGADILIDYKNEDFTKKAKGMDLALVLAGGDVQARTYPVMKRGGTLISTTGAIDEAAAEKYGVCGKAIVVHPDGDALSQMALLAEEDKLKTDVAIEYKLEHASEAWEVFTRQKPAPENFGRGKIILKI